MPPATQALFSSFSSLHPLYLSLSVTGLFFLFGERDASNSKRQSDLWKLMCRVFPEPYFAVAWHLEPTENNSHSFIAPRSLGTLLPASTCMLTMYLLYVSLSFYASCVHQNVLLVGSHECNIQMRQQDHCARTLHILPGPWHIIVPLNFTYKAQVQRENYYEFQDGCNRALNQACGPLWLSLALCGRYLSMLTDPASISSLWKRKICTFWFRLSMCSAEYLYVLAFLEAKGMVAEFLTMR